MTYLVVVLGVIAFFAGFFLLTQYEKRHEMRFFAQMRGRLDTNVERIEFIIEHIDVGAFVKEEIRNATNRAGHTVARLSLHAVRFVERLLTRLVRHLRVRHEDTAAPRESTREFVKTLSDFKDGLNATHPEIDGIEAGPEVE